MSSGSQDFFFDFPFRAHRDYVHSASICNRLATHFQSCDRLQLVLKRWMSSRIHFTQVDAVKPGSGTGYLKIERNGSNEIWELSEDKTHPVAQHEPYDEDALVAMDIVEGNRLTSLPGAGGTFFDRLIAANKVLINTNLDPKVQLIAAKLDMRGFPEAGSTFTVKLRSNIGTRIFKSDILIDDNRVGEVVFYGQ
jgi:hypothetical protein